MNNLEIIINGVKLSQAELTTLHVALNSFAIELKSEGLGDDDNGRSITAGYLGCVSSISQKMLAAPGTQECQGLDQQHQDLSRKDKAKKAGITIGEFSALESLERDVMYLVDPMSTVVEDLEEYEKKLGVWNPGIRRPRWFKL